MLAEIITIGDEILIGQIVDTNSAWMGRQLNLAGIAVKQITSVSDDAAHISEALAAAQKRAQVILITGGLGPTKDDITKFTLAAYFKMGMRRDAETLAHVESFFKRSNRPMLETNIRQADVPDGCTVIQNRNGTAPCMWFEQGGSIVVSMPGVPFEMMYLMDEEIIPRLKQRFALPAIHHRTILTSGLGESFLAAQIADLEDALPSHIKLAYLPKLGQVRLRLSARGEDEAALAAETDLHAQAMMSRLAGHVVIDRDIPLEKALIDQLKERNLTVSTAESCTGGYIAHLITQHPGCSAVFKGGVVSYAAELKQSVLGVSAETLARFGEVSEETAREMASGAVQHFHTDFAVAVTGIAGPDGAVPGKPVGTVWIAVASPNGCVARLHQFNSKRVQNIERSAAAALTMLLNELRSAQN
ncbi:competence/damage-inducible protein A [Pedobacter yulinensis]|uniref:CinA-like protein n=1 Tax=Pedobacter yulinensis TaxID=2126353 RepID=A0A2T3HLW7_9SPHI|nr:competence/damage-inducible protein A [Pedobacter yulinensis]PST83430.1 competence/damage-inducible protein A [Pedobacter yulinensis]